jgi:integrase
MLEAIQVPPSNPQEIPEEDIKAIISEINKAPLNVKVFFELLRDTSMQIKDLLDLDIEDITLGFNTATINHTITVKNQNLLELCRLQQSGPLFLSNWGNKADYYWAYRWRKKISPQYTIQQFRKAKKS